MVIILSVGTTGSYSQTFDLLSAKPSDKVASSLFFAVDSNKIVNAYKMFSFSSPVMKIRDSVFVIGEVNSAVSAVKSSDPGVARDFSLEQNFPNPFNPSTTIRFTVRKRAKVSVVLYDVTGKEVTTLVNDERESGSYDLHWNGTSDKGVSVASGTYFYRLLATADDGTKTSDTKRMALIR